MSAKAFDTLTTARRLETAGVERTHAEAIASAIGSTQERVATRADLEPLATKAELEPLATKAELAALETRLTNRFYGSAVALAGVVIASANLF